MDSVAEYLQSNTDSRWELLTRVVCANVASVFSGRRKACRLPQYLLDVRARTTIVDKNTKTVGFAAVVSCQYQGGQMTRTWKWMKKEHWKMGKHDVQDGSNAPSGLYLAEGDFHLITLTLNLPFHHDTQPTTRTSLMTQAHRFPILIPLLLNAKKLSVLSSAFLGPGPRRHIILVSTRRLCPARIGRVLRDSPDPKIRQGAGQHRLSAHYSRRC